ncbi:hypothetical protein B0T18DRAFT_16572 [Schizothecium vesticola]|uniref:Uncharacterized protein n=1 Tax=Schizothecium vesticola TaxID=314040 RepID=A0AA40KBU9_9PEZI|nr:hypothetical protein B0T18DRAFT_16572 [Schizothecium vesticola]
MLPPQQDQSPPDCSSRGHGPHPASAATLARHPFYFGRGSLELQRGNTGTTEPLWRCLEPPPGTRSPFFCCASTPAACPFFHFIPWPGSIPSLPVITTTTTSPPTSPFLLSTSLGSPFPSYFLPFLPLRTRHRQRLETSIRSLHAGFLPDLGAEAALMGTYYPSPWGSGLPTAFLLPCGLGDKMPILPVVLFDISTTPPSSYWCMLSVEAAVESLHRPLCSV